LTFLSNNFIRPASTIAQLYKCLLQIELFFKWIKQHCAFVVWPQPYAFGVRPNEVFESSVVKQKNCLKIGFKAMVLVVKMYV